MSKITEIPQRACKERDTHVGVFDKGHGPCLAAVRLWAPGSRSETQATVATSCADAQRAWSTVIGCDSKRGDTGWSCPTARGVGGWLAVLAVTQSVSYNGRNRTDRTKQPTTQTVIPKETEGVEKKTRLGRLASSHHRRLFRSASSFFYNAYADI